RGLIVVITVLAAGVAFVLSQLATATYEATATLNFQDPAQQTNEVLGQAASNFFPQNAATAGAEVVTRTDVAAAVAKSLRLDQTPEEIRDDVEAEVVP